MDNGQNVRDETNNDQRKATVPNKEESYCKNQHSSEMPSDHDKVELKDQDDECHDVLNPTSVRGLKEKEFK